MTTSSETDYQKWDKLPDEEFEQSSAPEKVEATTEDAAKTAPESDPDKTEEQVDEKLSKGLKKRFKELTTKVRNLEAQLATKPAPEPAKAEPAKPAATEAVAEGGAAKPELETFKTYEEYVLALTDWRADQRDLARQQAAERDAAAKAQQAKGTAWQTELKAARERYPDYDEVALQDVPISRTVHNAIVEGGREGADLAYYLGQNPEELKRINELAPVAATLALGKILATIDDAPEPAKPAAVSRAPRPPRMVAGSADADLGKEPDPSNFTKWSKWKDRQEARDAA